MKHFLWSLGCVLTSFLGWQAHILQQGYEEHCSRLKETHVVVHAVAAENAEHRCRLLRLEQELEALLARLDRASGSSKPARPLPPE